MRENTDQKNSEFGHFLRSVNFQARFDLERTLGGETLVVEISIALGNFHHEPGQPESKAKVN